ncbi:MAG: GDP-mannose 4,6-dehydratase, partial [Chloroflexi bacterium]|nr:GDP-mannose 4,6-dehydratase [Chloroflexota bacterium]
QYAEVHGLHVVRVRPFLQIGPHRSARFVAGSFARQVAEIELGLRPAVVEVGNVELRRDFTDVRDVARAYALAADRGTGGEVYNIASGTAYSLGEMLELMLQLADVRAEVRTREDLVRPRETPLLIGDASKLRAATGWGPCIAFEQSVADTLASWRQTVRRSVVTKGDRA